MKKKGLSKTLKKNVKQVDVNEVTNIVGNIHGTDRRIQKLSLELPLDLHKKIKARAALKGVSMKRYIITLMEDDLLQMKF